MLSALAAGESSITGLSPGEDVAATSVIVGQLGAARRDEDGIAYIEGPDAGLHPAPPILTAATQARRCDLCAAS